MSCTANGAGAQDSIVIKSSRVPFEQPDEAVVKAYHREIAWRHNGRGKRSRWPGMPKKRLRELEQVFASRCGDKLPDDKAGRDYLFIAFQHIVNFAKFPDAELKAWAAEWASWIDDDELEDLIVKVCAKPRRWKADTLAQKLGLTYEERTRLKISTIGAIDKDIAARKAQAKVADRERKAAQRRRNGALSREEYLANSLTRAKPWEAEAISERTWRRRRKRQREQKESEGVRSPSEAYLSYNTRTHIGQVAVGTALAALGNDEQHWSVSAAPKARARSTVPIPKHPSYSRITEQAA